MAPLVMGVLNVTPDSFSDGGRFVEFDAAVAHGLAMVAEGADVVDVGGESTRPGAEPVDEAEELRRVVPVVQALAAAGVRVSIDTTKQAVAAAAVEAGAAMVNDISASLWPVAAEAGVGWVGMHMRGTPSTMQSLAQYDDVVAEVCAFLADRAGQAASAGVAEVWVDPGLGFAKTAAHNLVLLRRLRDIAALGYPVLVGASRKSFLGALTASPPEAGQQPVPAPVEDRVEQSIAAAVWAGLHGAAMVRVHDVRATVQAMRLLPSTGSGVAA